MREIGLRQSTTPCRGAEAASLGGMDHPSSFDLTYIGSMTFRRQGRLFGTRQTDPFPHVYLIGRTGTGKSILLDSNGP